MKTQLVNQLFEQTETLKIQFIEKSKDFACAEFDRWVEYASWSYDKFLDKFGVNHYWSGGRITRTMNKKGYSIYHNCRSIVKTGLDFYVNKAERDANAHYEASIYKLAQRIEEKGCTGDFTMSTTHIGVNIETVINFDNKTVRAFTILAWGEIQKPHYRYLVK